MRLYTVSASVPGMRLMSKLHVASWGLMLGSLGHLACLTQFIPSSGWPYRCVAALVFVPWLTVYTISFCKQPPCGPRRFRHLLIFAMSWYALMTAISETLNLLVRPTSVEHFPIVIARALMYCGALTFMVFIKACRTIRGYENAVEPIHGSP